MSTLLEIAQRVLKRRAGEARAHCPACGCELTSPGSASCPDCQERAYTPGEDLHLDAVRPVASCRDFPPPGPVAPLGAPAGVEYEPGQDWQAEELARVYCPGGGGGGSLFGPIPPAFLDLENPARLCGACRARAVEGMAA